MIKLLVTGLFFLTFFPVFAEEPERIKILEKNLPETSGEARKQALKELAYFYRDTVAEKAIEYSNQFLNLVEDSDQNGLAYIHLVLGTAYDNQLNHSEALIHNLKALEIYEKAGNKPRAVIAKFKVGNSYMLIFEYQKALEYGIELIELHKITGDFQYLISSLMLAGKCYIGMDENEKAHQVFQEAEQIAVNGKYFGYIAWSRYYLGVVNFKMANLNAAEEIHTENIKLYNSLNDVFGSLGSKQKLGDIFLLTGKFGKAYDLFFDAYKFRSFLLGSRGENHFIATHYDNLGKIFFHAGDYKQANKYFDQGIEITEHHKFVDLKSQILYNKGLCFFKQNAFDQALSCFSNALHFARKSVLRKKFTILPSKHLPKRCK